MIVVKVELWSAVTGEKTELARMMIANEGVRSKTRRDYSVRTYIGRSFEVLQEAMLSGLLNRVSKQGRVENHANGAEHVWNLVAKGLTAMGYGELHGARLTNASPVKTPRRSAAEIEAARADEPLSRDIEAETDLMAAALFGDPPARPGDIVGAGLFDAVMGQSPKGPPLAEGEEEMPF